MPFMSYRLYIIGLHSNHILESNYRNIYFFPISSAVHSYTFIDGEKILLFLWHSTCWASYIVSHFPAGSLALILLVPPE